MTVTVDTTIRELRNERAKLDAAITALETLGNGAVSVTTTTVETATTGHRQVSAAGRERISQAQKARWAKLRETANETTGRKKRTTK